MAVDFKNKAATAWAFIKRIAARVWAYLKVAKMEWIVLIGVFAFDLISKAVINATIEHRQFVTVIPYFLNFHNLHNYDAAFGSGFIKGLLGEVGARIFFSVFAVAASVAFILVLIHQKGKSKWFRVALALFVAGAMGNCIDRMAYGYVRDFIEFVYFGQEWFGRTTWYVFNIADAALVSGVIMIAVYFIFFYKDKSKKKIPDDLTDELEFPEPEDTSVPAASETVAGVNKKAPAESETSEKGAESAGDAQAAEDDSGNSDNDEHAPPEQSDINTQDEEDGARK